MTTLTIINGDYLPLQNQYVSTNADTWSSIGSSPYGSWTNWNIWNTSPNNLQIRLDDDLNTSALRTPNLILGYYGTLAITLKVSDTGTFSGEETTYSLTFGQTYAITSARYYRWNITISSLNGYPAMLESFLTSYDTNYTIEELRSVNTASLQTSTGYRIVEHNLGVVNNCQITAHDTFNWVDRAYALPDSWSENIITPIPGIISKNPLTITLRDHFGVEVDGTVDITISGSRRVLFTDIGVITI